MSYGSMTPLSQHNHQLLPKNNSPTSHSCHSFPFPPVTGNCIELYWFMNAWVSTGSRIGEAEVRMKGWKWLWHCHPKLNSSAFKRYMWPLTLTLQPRHLTLPAKMVHATLLPSPMASSLGRASQHITFPFDPAAHERGCYVATQVPYLPLLNNQRGKKHVTAQLRIVLKTVFFAPCSNGQMKALQISFHSCTTKFLGVCFHTFLFCFRFSFVK